MTERKDIGTTMRTVLLEWFNLKSAMSRGHKSIQCSLEMKRKWDGEYDIQEVSQRQDRSFTKTGLHTSLFCEDWTCLSVSPRSSVWESEFQEQLLHGAVCDVNCVIRHALFSYCIFQGLWNKSVNLIFSKKKRTFSLEKL